MARITSFAHLSEGELYRSLSSSRWLAYSKETRLELFQEVENREAAKQGRPALEIQVFTPDEERNYLGAFNRLNPDVLELNENLILDSEGLLQSYSVADGLDTIIHEGRHAFQYHAINGNVTGVDEKQLKNWKMNEVFYTQEEPLYWQLEIERDARNFARSEMEKIIAAIREEKGIEDLVYEEFLFRQHRDEYVLSLWADACIDEEFIEAVDEYARMMCEMVYPDDDMSDASVFAEYSEQRRRRERDAIEELNIYIDAFAEELADGLVTQEKMDRPEKMIFTESTKRRGL